MVLLRIQRFLDDRGLTITDLAQLTGLEEETIRRYAQESINIDQHTAEQLRRIASKLNIPVAKLIQPANKQAGIKLKIIEKVQEQGLTLEELSERSGVSSLALAFYSTQILLQDKWNELRTQTNLQNIASVLGTALEDLVIVQDPPITQLRLNDFLREKGLNSEELSILYNVPLEDIDLLISQPINISQPERSGILDEKIQRFVCCAFHLPCC